jgi:hypothetical protein
MERSQTMELSMNAAPPKSPKPWWREPYVWLVIGGPLVVVVAGIATAAIAIRNPDPVLSKNTYQQQAL